jgi:hypothetical protein
MAISVPVLRGSISRRGVCHAWRGAGSALMGSAACTAGNNFTRPDCPAYPAKKAATPAQTRPPANPAPNPGTSTNHPAYPTAPHNSTIALTEPALGVARIVISAGMEAIVFNVARGFCMWVGVWLLVRGDFFRRGVMF